MERGEELLLQFLGAGKGKLQGGGAHGKRLSAGKKFWASRLGAGGRAAASCHEEGIAEPLLGEMPVCYGGRLVSRGDVGRRETGGVGMELGDVLEVGGCARERSNKRPRPWASSYHGRWAAWKLLLPAAAARQEEQGGRR